MLTKADTLQSNLQRKWREVDLLGDVEVVRLYLHACINAHMETDYSSGFALSRPSAFYYVRTQQGD